MRNFSQHFMDSAIVRQLIQSAPEPEQESLRSQLMLVAASYDALGVLGDSAVLEFLAPGSEQPTRRLPRRG